MADYLLTSEDRRKLEEALGHPGCEPLQDFYRVGPVQRAAVESFAAALSLIAGLPKVQDGDAINAKRYLWLRPYAPSLIYEIWDDQSFVVSDENKELAEAALDMLVDAAMKEHPQP